MTRDELLALAPDVERNGARFFLDIPGAIREAGTPRFVLAWRPSDGGDGLFHRAWDATEKS